MSFTFEVTENDYFSHRFCEKFSAMGKSFTVLQFCARRVLAGRIERQSNHNYHLKWSRLLLANYGQTMRPIWSFTLVQLIVDNSPLSVGRRHSWVRFQVVSDGPCYLCCERFLWRKCPSQGCDHLCFALPRAT